MNNLVVYYSRSGVTKAVATHLAEKMNCEIEEIIDLKDRSGPKGYFIAGKDAATKKLTEIKESQKDPAAYDTVIIGTPVWAFTMAPAVRTYIENNKAKFKNVSFFCTEGGSGGQRTFKAMEELCGKMPKSTFEVTEKEVKKDTYKSRAGVFIEKIIG